MTTPLEPLSWDPAVLAALRGVVSDARPNDIAVFDFDNTIICHDVGDALFETIAHKPAAIDEMILQATTPDLMAKNAFPTAEALLDRYERLCGATRHQGVEAVAAAGYTWIVQLMTGASPADLVRWSAESWMAEPAGRRYPLPFVYPEMVELLGSLALAGVRCYIVSATNVWTVRWTVRDQLNPLLARRFGPETTIPPERVLGLSLLLRDRMTGAYATDLYLVSRDEAYAGLDPERLDRYVLAPFFIGPMTTYGGKVGAVVQHIGTERPLLAAGDSLNDVSLLRYARNRLWIARLDRPDLHERAAVLFGEDRSSVLVQPSRSGKAAGFVGRAEVRANPEEARSLAAWETA